ncbi:MAG: putative manganese-dependent inorganic diphosphatase [Verrucomicrobiales bacterium]
MATYVIGHRNPDTDAICAALAYAELLRRQGMHDVEAACCGVASSRTAYVLEQAGVSAPRLLLDIRPCAATLCQTHVVTARADETLQHALDRLRRLSLRSLPVLDNEGRLRGILSLQKALDLLLPSFDNELGPRLIPASLRSFCEVLEGEFVTAPPNVDTIEQFILTVAAFSEPRFIERLETYPADRLVVVAGDRDEVQRAAVERGVKALIITGGNRPEAKIVADAAAQGTAILISGHDTATTTLLMRCAQRIEDAVQEDFVSFRTSTSVRELRAKTLQTSQALFPIVDATGALYGVMSRSDLAYPRKHKLILVDHNEMSQAVLGAEDAEILQVLDHHRVGGALSSSEPIRFVIEPVGSTCTLVARAWREARLELPPAHALLLAGGLISDTLLLKSPTTTDLDREILAWLEEKSGRNLQEFADGFFAAGSVLAQAKPNEAVVADCKDYSEYGWRISVAQVEEQSLDEFWEKKEELYQALKNLIEKRGLDFTCLLVTDITRQNSVLLTAGEEVLHEHLGYPQIEKHLYDLPGVVSRKKQLLPNLMRVLAAHSPEDIERSEKGLK